MNGGARPGAGRKPDPDSFRGWCRRLANDRKLWTLAERAVRADLRAGKVDSYFRFCEQGVGKPPQALKLTGEIRQDIVEYRVAFADGDPLSTAVVSLPETNH